MNLQLLMLVLLFVAGTSLMVGNGQIEKKIMNLYTRDTVLSLLAILICCCITAAMVIGLYTINLFATKPYDEPNNSSMQQLKGSLSSSNRSNKNNVSQVDY
jgi:Ca2+/H+ antiporter